MKKLFPIITAAVLLASSCSDWSDHYSNASDGSSGDNLWQMISSKPELSDFAEVLSNTTVFRQHKKTSVSYASILQDGQSLTVLAPVNGTFNKDSLIELTKTAKGDSAVEHFFIQNHIIRSPHSAKEQTTKMLNNKYLSISENEAGSVSFQEKNIHASNGTLHIMNEQLPYRYTIYERLALMPQFTEVGKSIAQYQKDEFLEDQSVSNGMIDGVKTYVDSVFYEYNTLMSYVGELNDEDSMYYVSVPSNEGWKEAMEQTLPYFKYSSNIEKADSLQRFWATYSLLADGIFSRTIQPSIEDSVKTYRYNKLVPQYGVFYKPFAEGGLFARAKGMEQCSNGYMYYYDKWPFTPTQTFFRKIEQEGEYSYDILNYSKCSYSVRSLNADSISKGGYLDIVPEKSTQNWTLTYKLPNTLAGKYDICVVVLPKTVEGEGVQNRPCRFKAAINYIDEEGKPKTYDCEGTTFESNKNKVDTIVVAKDFQFPVCNYDQNNDKISITLQSNVTVINISRYHIEMYLDCIFLRPKE